MRRVVRKYEPILTRKARTHAPVEGSIALNCTTCGLELFINSRTLDKRRLNHVFCGPLCKLKFLIKDRPIDECWIFPVLSFVWGGQPHSIRLMAYELLLNEVIHDGRNIKLTCGNKYCVNPYHIRKKVRRFMPW